MAKLIDADALKHKIDQEERRRIDPGWYDGIDTCREFIENAPTIPAIPVEWLEQQRDKRRAAAAAHSRISSMTVLEAINVVMELWQKEQEAR